MKLYKYKALPNKIDNLSIDDQNQITFCKDIITNSRLFMAPRESLNDPFEGMAIPISLGIMGSGSYSSLGLPHPIVEDYMNKYRILSLSSNPKSPIMWAHYANNYCGICFEFEVSNYPDKIQKVTYIDHQFDTLYDPEEDELYKAIEKSLLCKSKNWSYEDEYRIISKDNNQYFHFNEVELTCVIVGHRSIHSKEIISLAQKRAIPVYYTLTSTKNYEINIIQKLPDDLEVGFDTLKSV